MSIFADHVIVEPVDVRALEESTDEHYSSDSLNDATLSSEPGKDIHLQKFSNHGTENQTL
ncbi:hypothetical protein DPMN_181238 [Dreissena polymorpha]|uniref:Uncharacterized protein n=1 Tax=Dreissena polymorpha TaxID=45954 RepID=A0A9D4DDA8_DREPO|nr:hypothetical protein DPMN_181238 [Dreissena polymorpha]